MENKEKSIPKRTGKEILFGNKSLIAGTKVKSKIGGPSMIIKGLNK